MSNSNQYLNIQQLMSHMRISSINIRDSLLKYASNYWDMALSMLYDISSQVHNGPNLIVKMCHFIVDNFVYF